MKNISVAVLMVALSLALVVPMAAAKGGDFGIPSSRVEDPIQPVPSSDFRGARAGTLWIFDADFSTTTGDNAGWTSYDRSGSLGQTNRWHIDTVRITEAYLGSYAFWCGEENICWKQPRGYGNDWLQLLSKDLTGVTGTGGDTVTLEFDQRFAMEKNYDYGYVELSTDGVNFATLGSYTNGGFTPPAGQPRDWDYAATGHVSFDISSYAGQDITLRFRMESDGLYSAQDQADNTAHSVKDGAWEIDNVEIKVNDVQTWIEDCEGADTWTHDDIAQSGETGVQFTRGQYYIDFETGRPQACEDRDPGEWMYSTAGGGGVMVDDEDTWLVSPPIDVSGYENLVGQWDMWVDLPQNANDLFNLYLASNDEYDCVTGLDGMVDEQTGAWYGGPFWGVWTDDWTAFAGNDWLAIGWEVWNDEAPTSPHMAGVFLNRQRVGVPEPNPNTAFNPDEWEWFHDWFKEDLATAVTESARVQVRDQDGILSVTLMASSNGGPFEAYACVPESPTDPEWFLVPPPTNQMNPGSEIHFYLEATDVNSNVTIYPENAPDSYFEFSILPISATTTNPGILLVDKHKRRVPGRERDYRHTSEYYYREALGILGYQWETFDVDVESGSVDSEGPDTTGMKYYHTQIWWADDFDSYVMLKSDQYNLIQWLQQGVSKERNLLLSGLDISWELKSADSNQETLGFHDIWLASSYEGEVYGHTGASLSDTTAGLLDHDAGVGDWVFMNYDDMQCILETACPDPIESPDIIDVASGVAGAQVVADYKHDGCGTISPAGVAYTHPTLGYQTVFIGFGLEHMMDGVCGAGSSNYTVEGYYKTGIKDRVNFMGNVMGTLAKAPGYFGLTPTGTPTDVVEGAFKNALSQAYPNPFNPVTEIAFSVKEAGPVTIEVYNVAGRVVRTLLNTEFDGPVQSTVTWDGTNDNGERCASGVYFYRINAPKFTESRKMVMLK